MLKRLLHMRYLLQTLDHQEIALEVAAMRLFPATEAWGELIFMLERGEINESIQWIDDQIAAQSQLSQSGDISIDGLRTKAAMLEIQLSVLINRLSDAQFQVNEYRQRHYRELNEVIGKLLYLKREILFFQAEKNADYQNEFAQAEMEYKRFRESPNPINSQTLQKLSDTEQKMIQRLFRQASKLCHPDLVRDDQQETASQWFIDLSRAYMANDLDAVAKICEALESGEILFVSKTGEISEQDLLRSAISRLKNDVDGRSFELMHLEESPLMKTICSISDWDSYFAGMKAKFEGECERLELELNILRG